MFSKKYVFSVSSSNTFLIYNNKGMQLMRKQVALEYSLIQKYSSYLSCGNHDFSWNCQGIVEHKFCNDQSFSLTTVQTKTASILHKNACGESTVATLLSTEDSIKNFLREFYTNSFRGITLATLIMMLPPSRHEQKDTQGVEVGCFRYRVLEKPLLFWRWSPVEYFPEPAIHSVAF